jgi:hypothetical protein
VAWEGLSVGSALQGIRRARRSERLTRELSATPLMAGPSGNGFDPNLGASGRPSTFYEYPSGPPTSRGAAVWLSPDQWTTKLKWNGFHLTVEYTESKSAVYTIDLGEGATSEVVEAALFASSGLGNDTTDARHDTGSLHFLDAYGYAVFVVAKINCSWREVTAVLESAGLSVSVYSILCSDEAATRIARLLFPRRRRCTVIYGPSDYR